MRLLPVGADLSLVFFDPKGPSMGEEDQNQTPTTDTNSSVETPQREVDAPEAEESAPTEPEVKTGTADTTEPDRDKEVRAAQDAELEAEREERRRQLGQ